MYIVHVLLSKRLGGLEQAFVDYTEALSLAGHEVAAVLHPASPFRAQVKPFAKDVHFVNASGFYDALGAWRLRRAIAGRRPDMFIAHNARAIGLAKWAAWGMGIPVIGVSHSEKTRRSMTADALLVLTEDMRQKFIAAGYPPQHIAVQPNMIRLDAPPPAPRAFSNPPVIGALGRMVEEKGFAQLLQALALLKGRDIAFRARIAGDGELSGRLREQAEALDLSDDVEWPGWVEDKQAFYRSLDIFVLPSLYEPFGIVVLEAMAARLPVVASNLPGPASMVGHEVSGQLAAAGDCEALAEALAAYIAKPDYAARMAQAGFARAQDFSLPSGAKLLDANINGLLAAIPQKQTA